MIYFVTPHAVIVKKSSGITSVRQLAGRKASSASTSTAGGNLKEVVPDVNLVYVKDYAIAFAALEGRQRRCVPDRRDRAAGDRAAGRQARTTTCFLPDFAKSRNVGFALKKDEPRLQGRDQPRACSISRASGEAAKIFDAWFGPGTEQPMPRKFRIQPD